MIRFEFANLHTDPEALEELRDAVLGVVADFSVRVGARLLYSEVDFPVVEFGRAMLSWLNRIESSDQDFEYDSAEAAEPGLIWIRREGPGWRIGSTAQEYPEVTVFSTDEIRDALHDFRTRLERHCLSELRLDISPLFRNVP